MDTLYEIFASLKRNKLRTALTGFAVAWGIFMLIILLGAGNGLMNGIQSNFGDNAQNIVRIWGGTTNVAYRGFNAGRNIQLQIDDIDYLKRTFPKHIKFASPLSYVSYSTISVGVNYSSNPINGVYPEVAISEGYKIYKGQGRFINQQDILEKRKVVLMDEKTAAVLFKSENPVGRYVKIGSILFKVAGIYDSKSSRRGGQTIFIPYTTAQDVYNIGRDVNQIVLMVDHLGTKEANEQFSKDVRKALAMKKQFSESDQSAIWLQNQYEQYMQTQFIFNAISIAIWVIGLFTLISGIVGVSNIMLISVKERTKEFGIRKAIGASPISILKVVILESIIITSIFGYIGMLLGVGITEAVNIFMESQAAASVEENSMTAFLNPTVDLGIALGATLTLVVAGTLAGFFPARNAVMIKPVTALAAK